MGVRGGVFAGSGAANWSVSVMASAQVWFDAMKPIDLTPIYLLLLDE